MTDDATIVELICMDPGHVQLGTDVADGDGTVTVVGRRWAYCSAGLMNTPHDWRDTGGVSTDSIRHADLASRQ